MNTMKLIILLALIPTFLLSSDSRGEELYGVWYDNYSDTKLEIKHTRRGIKVKHHGGLFSRWRTYNYMGRGLYDDCNGKVIISRGYDQIEWRKGRRRSIVLSRYNDYNRGDSYHSFDSYDNREYPTSRSRSYGRSYPTTYRRDNYCGAWYNSDRGYSLSIEAYGGRGFRARLNNVWTYYEPYNDHYRDRRGNRYYINDGYLSWRSYDGRRKIRFRKR